MADEEDEQPSLGFLLVRLGEAVNRRFVAAIDRLQLRAPELRALVLIDRDPGVSQRELARLMPADPGNLVDVLDRLEARALIERRVSATDRRRHSLKLTPAGARLLARATDEADKAEREVLAPLSEEEQGALEAMALRVWQADTRSPLRPLALGEDEVPGASS
jgi:DNA-binding MarR family transcriptional regulator